MTHCNTFLMILNVYGDLSVCMHNVIFLILVMKFASITGYLTYIHVCVSKKYIQYNKNHR